MANEKPQVYKQVASERLLERLNNARLLPEIVDLALGTTPKEPRTVLTPEDWNLRTELVEEGAPSFALIEEMSNVAPQAILRDVFRPIHEISNQPWDRDESRDDLLSQKALADARTEFVPRAIPKIEPVSVTILAHRRIMRDLMRTPTLTIKRKP